MLETFLQTYVNQKLKIYSNKYGHIVDIELKISPRPPVYCFMELEDVRDVEDAIRCRDGYTFDSCCLRCCNRRRGWI
ncbi:hypothetical protein Sjap_025620 [Stephania japonica]|uniref:RRM domain-containing protein n=1 Tax=Stephania japonica TaxID=461633 RepID=A0AAP0E9V5_9MAGN